MKRQVRRHTLFAMDAPRANTLSALSEEVGLCRNEWLIRCLFNEPFLCICGGCVFPTEASVCQGSWACLLLLVLACGGAFTGVTAEVTESVFTWDMVLMRDPSKLN